jgi:hypothetical protein
VIYSFSTVIARVIEAFVPLILIFLLLAEKTSGLSVFIHWCTTAITSSSPLEVFSVRVLLQGSDEVRVSRWKVQAVPWLGKTLSVKLQVMSIVAVAV